MTSGGRDSGGAAGGWARVHGVWGGDWERVGPSSGAEPDGKTVSATVSSLLVSVVFVDSLPIATERNVRHAVPCADGYLKCGQVARQAQAHRASKCGTRNRTWRPGPAWLRGHFGVLSVLIHSTKLHFFYFSLLDSSSCPSYAYEVRVPH